MVDDSFAYVRDSSFPSGLLCLALMWRYVPGLIVVFMICWFDVPGSSVLKRSQKDIDLGEKGWGGLWRRGGRGDGHRDVKRKNIKWNIKKSENERKVSGAALRRMTFNLM